MQTLLQDLRYGARMLRKQPGFTLIAVLTLALGVLVARWGLDLLINIRPSDNTQFWTAYTRAFDFFTINLDWRVLGFNFALALLTGLLFGLTPALQSSFINVNDALKEGAGGSATGFQGARKLNTRSLLIVCEVALSLVLAVGAGLMLKSLLRLQSVHLGFVPENVLTMTVYARDAQPEFYEQLLARVQALPGVESASFSRNAPLSGRSSSTVMDIEGRADLQEVGVGYHSVSPDYFKTLGIALRRGRVFTAQDRVGAQPSDVLRLMLGQGLKLIALGLALGWLAALPATRLLKGMLFGVGATDPLTFLGITFLLAFTAMLACWIPARRATKIDPMIALRCD